MTRPAPPLPPALAGCLWVGWLRTVGARGGHEVRGPWRAVAGADSYGEAWQKLLAVAGGQHNERVVLGRLRRP